MLLLSLTLTASASEPYFCIRQGSRLRYERRYARDNALKWTQDLYIEKSDSGRICYSSTFYDARGKLMYRGSVPLEAVYDMSGTLTVDLARSVAAIFGNYLPGRAVSWEPCLSVLPAEMVPGQRLADADFTVRVAGLGYRVRVNSREVVRREMLETPAGEFDCVVVREHKVEKGLGRNRVTTALTWYSKGVGMVRHDTYDDEMELDTSEVLIEIGLE